MKLVFKHALWLRVTHWANFLFLSVMVWSGLLIYWANDVYPGFFPNWFYSLFVIDHRLAEGMAIHFTVAWLFVLNGLLYGALTLGSGHWRDLLPDRESMRYLGPTMLRELRLSREVPPQGLYNSAQRLAYPGIVLIAGLEIWSGFAIYKPVQLSLLTRLLGGYAGVRLIHFSGMILLVLFFGVHVFQVVRAGWNNFRSIIAGYEVKEGRKHGV